LPRRRLRRPGALASLLRALVPAVAGAVLSTGPAAGQGDTDPLALKPARAGATAAEQEWSFSLSVSGYVVPGDRNYAQPTFTADRGWLHLEARYNYEDLDTGSAWVGYNLNLGDVLARYNMSLGETVGLQVTPMVGGVFGRTTGIAPGYRATLSWWRLDLYSEGEYVFDTGDASGDFFYTWSELGISPVAWLRAGVAVQRTQAYRTDVDVQWGLFAGTSYRMLSFAAYVFNLGRGSPTIVLSSGIRF
jgi:hypothetical protein